MKFFLHSNILIFVCIVLFGSVDSIAQTPKVKKISTFEKGGKLVQKAPNILFIPVDDLRPDLGCYGNDVVQSPNIDRLASNGVVFNRAYCQQAVCNASRASLLTGLRPDSTQIWDLQTNLRDNLPDVTTLPQFFRQHGYYTVSYGKTFHNIFPDPYSFDEDHHADGFPEDPDAVYVNLDNLIIQKERELQRLKNGATFDRYGFIYTKANSVERGEVDDDDMYYDGAQTTMAVEKLKELKDRGEPFFLSVGYYKPHLPFTSPKKYWDLYNRNDIKLAEGQFVPKGSPLFAVHGDAEMRSYLDRKDLPRPEEHPYDEDKQRELIHAYYACISYIDAQIGRLLDELDRLGLSENTIVVLWGDHGWKLGEHNSWAKMSNYEIDTRVPLIISGKGVKAKNKKSNALVEFVDIFPTLLEMADFAKPDYLQGTSMVHLLRNPNEEWKTAVFSQYLLGRFGPPEYRTVERMGYTIRTDKYRYVEWYYWDKDGKTRGDYITNELFDHDADPGETVNIVTDSKNKKIVKDLKARLQNGWRYEKPRLN